MSNVVTMGEMLLRISPEGYNRFIQGDRYIFYYAGAEANTAVSLAEFGIPTTYITKVPDNPLGQGGINQLRRFGVDTGKILIGGPRLGLYFLEKGTSQRPAICIYDRTGSSMALSQPEEYDWDDIFSDAMWFHFSGITPAISDSAAETVLAGCKAAHRKGITISCDLNYRSRLWSGNKARKVMSELCQYVDVCIANDNDVLDIFPYRYSTDEPVQRAREMAVKLMEEFHFRQVSMILVLTGEQGRKYTYGVTLTDGKFYESKKYPADMVDSVGSGDTFGAGMISQIIRHESPQKVIEFATAAASLKFSVPGDMNMVTEDEVRTLAERSDSSWIKR